LSAIAGVLCLTDECSSKETIYPMMESLRKYPADDSRIWSYPSLSLGCHALWITPESVLETLPRYSAFDGLAITADAIIDNREELFERLGIASGKRKSMTELLPLIRNGETAPPNI
jgi:asparagine synthase (glutamine-hydrolysing)